MRIADVRFDGSAVASRSRTAREGALVGRDCPHLRCEKKNNNTNIKKVFFAVATWIVLGGERPSVPGEGQTGRCKQQQHASKREQTKEKGGCEPVKKKRASGLHRIRL